MDRSSGFLVLNGLASAKFSKRTLPDEYFAHLCRGFTGRLVTPHWEPVDRVPSIDEARVLATHDCIAVYAVDVVTTCNDIVDAACVVGDAPGDSGVIAVDLFRSTTENR